MQNVYQQIIDTLSRCRRVLVTTHVRPDGDAIGTAAAMVLALRGRGIEAQVLLLSGLPAKYAFVFHENNIAFSVWEDLGQGPAFTTAVSTPGAGGPEAMTAFLDPFDSLLVVDTGTWSQLPNLRPHLEHWPRPRLILDHHPTQEDWADLKLVDTAAAAAGEMAAELIERWQIPLEQPLATCIYIAIASDTGWFQFANTRPRTLRLAARLMEAGVETDRIYQLLYQNERYERLALQARALQSLELACDQRLAMMTLTSQDFSAAGADPSHTENLVNLGLQIATVEVSALLVSLDDKSTRISLRSKGQVDLASFTSRLGGGGHARAAAMTLEKSPAEARQQLLDALRPYMQSSERPATLKNQI